MRPEVKGVWDLDSEVPTVPLASEAYPNSKVKESPGLIDHHLLEAQPRRQPCRLAPALLLAVESSVPRPCSSPGRAGRGLWGCCLEAGGPAGQSDK